MKTTIIGSGKEQKEAATKPSNGKGTKKDTQPKKSSIADLQKELNEKLEKLEEFNVLNGAYQKLKEVKQELTDFTAGSDEDTRKIELKSGFSHHAVFTTNKGDIIDEVLKIINARVDERIEKAEGQLAEFEL